MKAIVMAGGEGTRLRPVTGGRPKPMVELCGKPVLEHTVDLLRKHGVTELCLTLKYLPRVIEDYFEDGAAFGVRITYRVETEPLGTAGGVRACRDFAGEEDVLVLSGDAVCDFDLASCAAFHRERGAEATLVLTEHASPTAFGLVETGEAGRIVRFVEKPSWERVTTGRVNTGVYVLSPSVFDLIPAGRPCDFGREVFPHMLEEGRKLFGYDAHGYWCDVGTPEAYRQCCADVLAGKAKLETGVPERAPGIWSAFRLPEGARLIPPVFLGQGVRVEPGAAVGPNCVLGQGSLVAAGAQVSDSVLNGASVGENAHVTRAIVGREAVIGPSARVSEGCVVGDGASIGYGAVLTPGVRIDCRRTVPEGSLTRFSLMGEGTGLRPVFRKDGELCGDYLTELTAEHALAAGGVLGTLGRVAAASSGGSMARLLLTALGCGVTGAGGAFFEMDARFETALAASAQAYGFPAAVFVRQRGNSVSMAFFEEGLPAGTALSRKLEAAAAGEYPRVCGPSVGETSRASGTDRLYAAALRREAERLNAGRVRQRVAVLGNGPENRLLREVLEELGVEAARERSEGEPAFSVQPGGFALTAWDETGRSLDASHMQAVTAAALLRLGFGTLASDFTAPFVLDALAERRGAHLLRRLRDGAAADALMREQPYLRDGLCAAIAVIAAMGRDEAALRELSADVPAFSEAERRVEVASSRARAMELLTASCAEFATELTCGLSVDTGAGRARIAPARESSALVIHGECGTPEQTEELLARFERIVRGIDVRECSHANESSRMEP